MRLFKNLISFLIIAQAFACGGASPQPDFSQNGNIITAELLSGAKVHSAYTSKKYSGLFGPSGRLEIQIIDTESQTQLACVQFGEIDDNQIEFWNLEKTLTVTDNWPENDVTQIQIYMIHKEGGEKCLSAFSSQTGEPIFFNTSENDELLGQSNGITDITLFNQKINMVENDSFVVLISEDEANPIMPEINSQTSSNPELILDQMQFFGDYEFSNPEIQVHILDLNNNVLGCTASPIKEVDEEGFIHANLNAEFTPTLRLNDHSGENVKLAVIEKDDEDACPQAPNFNDADIIYTEDILYDDLFGARIDFDFNRGFLQFVTIAE